MTQLPRQRWRCHDVIATSLVTVSSCSTWRHSAVAAICLSFPSSSLPFPSLWGPNLLNPGVWKRFPLTLLPFPPGSPQIQPGDWGRVGLLTQQVRAEPDRQTLAVYGAFWADNHVFDDTKSIVNQWRIKGRGGRGDRPPYAGQTRWIFFTNFQQNNN